MYYACQIWLIPTIKQKLIRKLLNCSSQALKLIVGDDYSLFSFDELHLMFARAKPTQWSDYVVANQIHSIITNEKPESIWIDLQESLTLNNRTDCFNFEKTNSLRVGLNKFTNRLSQIAQKFKFKDFALSKESFKVKCKRLLFS